MQQEFNAQVGFALWVSAMIYSKRFLKNKHDYIEQLQRSINESKQSNYRTFSPLSPHFNTFLMDPDQPQGDETVSNEMLPKTSQ